MPAALQCAEQQPLPTTAVKGKRDYAAHTDNREREEPDQPDIETRRELPRGARAVGTGQHHWCCLASASDRGAGLVVAVVVEQ